MSDEIHIGQRRRHIHSGLLLKVERIDRDRYGKRSILCSYPENPPPHGNPLRPYDEESLHEWYPVVPSA